MCVLSNVVKSLLGQKEQQSFSYSSFVPKRRRALLVGINKYADSDNNLRGCVNDTEQWWKILVKYGYKADDIRVLNDQRATQDAIIERLNWLLGEAQPGDDLFWAYSGHGSFVRPRTSDGSLMNEVCQILCPHDLDWENPFTDKMIAEFLKKVPLGARVTFISDCCHSASLDRDLAPKEHGRPKPKCSPRFILPPFDIRARSQDRDLQVKTFGARGFFNRSPDTVTFIDQRHVFHSGCQDNQTSADAFIDGSYHGALTYYLGGELDKNGDKQDWLTVHKVANNRIAAEGYDQVPELVGLRELLEIRPFIM